MWLEYITLFIFIIVIIRLILIMTGEMTAQQKVSKASNWIVGIVLVSVSWKVINAIFPNINIGEIGSKKSIENNRLEKKIINRRKTEKDSITIQIKFNK